MVEAQRGKAESRKGGAAESERGKAERSGNVGKRSSHKGVPLTLAKEHPSNYSSIYTRDTVRIRRGAAGLRW